MLQLGVKAKDKITGHEGILTGRASYITGCDQYLVQPPAKDGEFKNGTWIDEGRLEVTGEGVTAESVKADDNGGPGHNAPVK
jgi:hypothetical protein